MSDYPKCDWCGGTRTGHGVGPCRGCAGTGWNLKSVIGTLVFRLEAYRKLNAALETRVADLEGPDSCERCEVLLEPDPSPTLCVDCVGCDDDVDCEHRYGRRVSEGVWKCDACDAMLQMIGPGDCPSCGLKGPHNGNTLCHAPNWHSANLREVPTSEPESEEPAGPG